ncbi:MAG: hypothetical protein OCD76_24455, partial [Reichenbachiella sp.]
MDDFQCLLNEEKPDIVVVTETWLKPTIPSSDIVPNYYSVFRKDRPGEKRGGGVMIAVHNRLLSSVCMDMDTDCEIVWVKVELCNAKDLFIGAFYRPPTSKHTLDELDKSIDKLRNSNSIVCLCGDFNLPNITWDDCGVKPNSPCLAISNSLIEITNDAGLMQMNSSPTRNKNILDLYFTNNPTLVRQTKVIPGIGDHDALLVDSLIKPIVNNTVSRKVYQYHKGNMTDLNEELSRFRVNFLANCATESVDDMWSSFHSEMMRLQEEFIPSKMVKPQQSLPWITPAIKRKLKKKQKLFKVRSTSKAANGKYKHFKKLVQKQIRQARWDHINSIVNQDGDKARKGFWRYVKQFKADNTGIAVLKKDGVTATTPEEKAKLLNTQFSSVFTNESTDSVPQSALNQYPDIPKLVISVNGVEKLLANLNTGKAAGPDGLSGKLLKGTSTEIAPILHAIFQRSIDEGTVPGAWKHANISPVFKKKDRCDPANYRPVSLTCISCKILEHI